MRRSLGLTEQAGSIGAWSGADIIAAAGDCRSRYRELSRRMIWQGKALGALIGVVAAGPVGALFGAFLGHLYDAQAELTQAGVAASAEANL
jgi:hypothetical protein